MTLTTKAVQCQKTRLFIGPSHRKAGGVWECPHCGRDETYAQAELVDPEISSLVLDAVERARALFGVEPDDQETRIWLGDTPETVHERDQKAFHVYLARDSNWLQFAYSGAHEAFHRACSPGAEGGHWVDEVLAVHFSLRYLREIGLEKHAAINTANLEMQAKPLPEICGALPRRSWLPR